MITPAQCQSGRKLLRWSINQLATKSGLGVQAVVSFDTGTSQSKFTGEKLQGTFEAAGLEFFTDAGGKPSVRLRSDVST